MSYPGEKYTTELKRFSSFKNLKIKFANIHRDMSLCQFWSIPSQFQTSNYLRKVGKTQFFEEGINQGMGATSKPSLTQRMQSTRV